MKISPQNYNGELISDEQYKKQKDKLNSEKKNIEEKLNSNVYSAEKWRETAEKTFEFACYARHWFENGDRQTKREIIAGLGSDLILTDKIVRINLEKPLQYIETAIQKEPTISEKLEPEFYSYPTAKMETYWNQNPTLLPVVDHVSTFMLD